MQDNLSHLHTFHARLAFLSDSALINTCHLLSPYLGFYTRALNLLSTRLNLPYTQASQIIQSDHIKLKQAHLSAWVSFLDKLALTHKDHRHLTDSLESFMWYSEIREPGTLLLHIAKTTYHFSPDTQHIRIIRYEPNKEPCEIPSIADAALLTQFLTSYSQLPGVVKDVPIPVALSTPSELAALLSRLGPDDKLLEVIKYDDLTVFEHLVPDFKGIYDSHATYYITTHTLQTSHLLGPLKTNTHVF